MSVKTTTKHTQPTIQPIDFSWTNNPDIKNLLDAISSILAEEYIEIAKQNRDIFSNEK